MHNKLIKFLSTIIFCFIPILTFSETFETKISADKITVDYDEQLYATGNVIVQYGNSQIKAKALKFNQKTKEIKFKEIQSFQDGNV